MPEGVGEAIAAVPPGAAFSYLADPRRAPEWFAGVKLPEPPQGPLGTHMTWRFVQQGGQVVPVRMAEYEPPRRFAWQTTYAALRSNLRWTTECLPTEGEPSQTLLRMTIHLDPSPLARLVLLLTFGRTQRTLAVRAQSATERAREVLLDVAEVEGHEGHARPKPPGNRPRRRGRS